MKKPIKITWPSFIVVVSLTLLITYAFIDAFIWSPKHAEKVEYVVEEFDSLKFFLDAKLPQIEGALEIHTRQIEEQNLQLERLDELTRTLKENSKK